MAFFKNLRLRFAWRRAWALEQEGRHAEAAAGYERVGAEADGPLKAAALLRAGLIAGGLGELAKSRKLLQAARDAAPDDATAWLHYANACLRVGESGTADEAYHEALKRAPGRPDILHHQAVYYGERMAKAGLQAARRAGLALYDLLDRPGGESQIAALGFNRELPALFVRNFSLEKQLPEDGLEILAAFADRPAGPGTGWLRPVALNHLGLLLANTGKYDEALAKYEEALKLRPGFIEARFNRGMTGVRRHSWDEARRDFSEYSKRFPTSPVPTFAMALLHETKGDLKEAERLYRFFLERVRQAPPRSSDLAALDIARTWIDHAKNWLEASSRPSEPGEEIPGAGGAISDRPRGT